MKTAVGLSENASYKVVALLITLILWVIILGSREATNLKTVTTDYLLPRDMMIVNHVPREVQFRVAGPRLALKRFGEINEPLTVDLTSAVEGLSTIRIHPDSINVPPSIRVVNVSPSVITPNLERIIKRMIPVEVQTKGDLAMSRRLVSLKAIPSQWEVTGARSVVERLKTLKTIPLDLGTVTQTSAYNVPLILDDPGLKSEKDAKIRVEAVVK